MNASSQKPKEGDRVMVSATVSNTGNGAAGASTTEFRLQDGTLLGTATTPALAAGASATVQVGWDTRGLNGEHVVSARADAGSTVTESAEGNNVGQLTVTIKGNKVENGSFEQPNEEGSAPEAWQASSTGAGSSSWSDEGGSDPDADGDGDGSADGGHAVTITGSGRSAALYGLPTWTSAPISVTAGELLTLTADVQTTGMSSAPTVGLAYLGQAGELLQTVKVLTAPLTSDGFTALEQTITVPAGVTSVRVVLAGFAPTDTRTNGTVTFDDIGLYEE